ncbi:Hypothetical predicted protein [Mytilus galloprovincialis]|uniref:TANC1/2-like winged helix domain-containing protein n=1 Tax=Mytilus galloprovincialis TaxID=29158 RepID=A0A8B6FBH7_MYTGA|nr:Hypothetical predicted protein [Mytilus galloprovincialis]
MNLERAFDIEPRLFEELMPIFEVLCTITKHMTEEQIFEVANISPANRRKTERVIGNELGHFLIFSDGNLSLLHKCIADFLTCKSRKHLRFFVNKDNGHTLFGAYFLKSPYFSDADIVDVVYHVAMSGNDEWKNVLINNYTKHIINDTKTTFYLQQVVRDFNSYTTTNLLLKMTNMKHINDKDERNMSAAFIAASHGNEHALQCLLDNGADPYSKYGVKDTCLVCNGIFNWIPYSHGRRQQDHTIVVVYANLTIEENYSFYDDWYLITCDTALNAAVRNGHAKIVELLLAENINTLNCTAYDGKNTYNDCSAV